MKLTMVPCFASTLRRWWAAITDPDTIMRL